MSITTIWEQRVHKEYKLIENKRNATIREEWTKNCNKVTEEDEKTMQKVNWIKINTNSNNVLLLNEVSRIPPMFNWILTKKNAKYENNPYFNNIPYIDDQTLDSDNNYVKELINSYDRTQNTNDKAQILNLQDAEFLQLVEKLNLKYIPLKRRKVFPETIIFESISSKFSNEVTPQELTERFVKLLIKENTKETQYSSPKSTLQKFRNYFCPRCFIYNCDLHRGQEKNTSNEKKCLWPEMPKRKEPCGNNCFMLRKENSNAIAIKLEAFNESIWTNDDKELCFILQNIFPKNYCAIAEAMMTKTCQNIYDLIQSKQDDISDKLLNKDNLIATRPKKSSRTYKNWSNYHFKRFNNSQFSGFHEYAHPCNHDGDCRENCSCYRFRNFCEKFCNCSSKCLNRFIGCRCKVKCSSKSCPCVAAGRECDPDLCKVCGADEFEISRIQCKNVSIQRGLTKHLLLAPSDVAGWGIFIKDGAKKHDFISEYCGEIITQAEADRRGKVYDKIKCSFLFELNDNYVVDATREGNKIRFANHSKNPNCFAKVLMVLGDHRIGIYAKRDILPGEELFFDYKYSSTEQLNLVKIER